MTQLTNEHFELHSANKDKMHKAKKFGVALAGLNNNINRLEQLKSDTDGYVKESLDTIIDNLTDVLVDLKMETGVDV